MRKLRIGMVGLGRVAAKTHLPVLKTLDYVDVVAGVDSNAERAQRVKSIFGLNRIYSDYEEMYESEKLNAVYVCLPSFLHKDACAKALNRGLHVLCEKPMCMSLEEAEELTTLAEEKGLVLMPGYKKRYAANFVKAKKMIEEGLLGKVVQVEGTFVTPGPYISWDPKSDWYLDHRWHGVVYDIGCHIVDLLLYVMPFEVRNVRSVGHQGFLGYTTPTNVSCVFEMGYGTVGGVTMGWRASTDVFSLAIHGTAGDITATRDYINYVNPGTDPVDKVLSYLDNVFGEITSVIRKIGDKILGKNFYLEDFMQAEAFCKAVTGEKVPPIDGNDAVRVHKFLQQVINEGARHRHEEQLRKNA